MKQYDVIIIGAGPSGIFCAYELIHAKTSSASAKSALLIPAISAPSSSK